MTTKFILRTDEKGQQSLSRHSLKTNWRWLNNYHDCRMNLSDTLYGLLTISRFANHFDIEVAFQSTAQSLPHHGMVIHQ